MNHIWPNVGKAKMGLRGSSFLALDCLTKVPWFIETDHQKMELAHKLAINKKICNFCLILPFWPSQWWVKLPKFLWIWTKIVDFLLMLHFRASFIFHWSVFISILNRDTKIPYSCRIFFSFLCARSMLLLIHLAFS